MNRITAIADFISDEDMAFALACINRARSNNTMTQYQDNPHVLVVPETDLNSVAIIKKYSDILTHNHKVLNGFAKPLYTTQAQLCFWPPKSFAGQHQDSHKGFGFIQFSSVIYLNDDFEGGEICFPHQEVHYSPKRASACLFPSGGSEYVHGVAPVIKGDRFTIAMFHSSVYEKSLDAKYAADPASPQALVWTTHNGTSQLVWRDA